MRAVSEAPMPVDELHAMSWLARTSKLIAEADEPLEVVDPVLEQLHALCGLNRATFWVLDPLSGELTIQAAYGLSGNQRRRGRYRLGEGVTGSVVATGEPAVVPRATEADHFLHRTRAPRDADVGFVCVPVVDGGETLGALSAERTEHDEDLLWEDARLLSILGTLLAPAVRRLRSQAPPGEDPKFQPANLVGRSKAIRLVYEQVRQVARSEATVLLRGESGVGKELVAQAVHEASARSDLPFVKVNCAALPQNLLESELFGHERGAFTGAMAQRKGRFEMAQGGTIFLDEIGDLPMATQVLLLRVLQEREFERVGGNDTLQVDVRVIAATNRPLETLIEEGKFRADLYYRLNVFPIYVPPLRERRADILLLSDWFVERFARSNSRPVRRISTPAIDMLMAYHWPGNVRELANCIERAVILTDDEVIRAQHLPPTLQTAEVTGTADGRTLEAALGALECEMLVESLKTNAGNMAAAARGLGVTERVMGLRVRKYGLDPRRYKRGR